MSAFLLVRVKSKRLIGEIARPIALLSRTLTTRITHRPLQLLNSNIVKEDYFMRRSCHWDLMQYRGYKVFGSDLRAGNVIERKGRIYQVIKAQHTQHGRGGATIQVELRDIESGSKVNQKLRTDEALEGIFVEEKRMTCLYTDDDTVYLMDPKDFEQIEVSKELFGKNVGYLKDEMSVTIQFYDGKPMSASVPKQVTCTVVQAQDPAKGLTATPQYKKVLLDNGLTMLVPEFIVTGDRVVVSTTHDEYLTRAKE
uniref:Elongation factor P n=1 Tax=Sedum alfredii TaxID=439688 RepID=A0A8E4V0H2_9MAGN|nr:elongation factor P [Sedum alfredii]